MPNWKRITLVIFVLIGGTMSFGYWSLYQFDNALDDLSASSVANILTVTSSLEKDTELASTSLETTLTADMLTASSSLEQDAELASTSLETSKALTTTSADLELSFNFPKDGVYVDCTYPISWQSPTIINLLEADLIDAGARKSVGPIASESAKENTLETDSQNLNWKVGVVWPGEYYIKVLKINGADVEIRSKVFTIKNIPKGMNTDEREKICKKSGGLF